MRNFSDYISKKNREYPGKFDSSNLNPTFIPYFESGQRIEVDFGHETKRGTIGVSTGWKPVFLLVLTSRSTGSSWTIGMNDKVTRVIR